MAQTPPPPSLVTGSQRIQDGFPEAAASERGFKGCIAVLQEVRGRKGLLGQEFHLRQGQKHETRRAGCGEH